MQNLLVDGNPKNRVLQMKTLTIVTINILFVQNGLRNGYATKNEQQVIKY